VKVTAVVVVAVTITWQTRTQHQSTRVESEDILTQQAGMIPQPWVEHRKAQVKELTRTMPNRFALSKAYYGTENPLLEAVELERVKELDTRIRVSTPKS